MKKKNVFWGAIFIISALLIILSSILSSAGFVPGVPLLNLILGVLCLAWLLSTIARRYFVLIYFPMAFIYILFKEQIGQLIGASESAMLSNWVVLLCALLLSIGTGILSTGKKSPFNGGEVSEATRFKSWKSQSVRRIDSGNFVNQTIECNMSNCEVFFENIDAYYGGGTLTIDNNMANLIINIPKEWHIIADIENNLGHIAMSSSGDPNGKVINIVGDNSMGRIQIKLI